VHSDVDKVGTLRVHFAEADLSKFAKKKQKREGHLFSKDTWYDLEMICNAAMADEVGILNFTVVCQDQQCGVVRLTFPHD